jgi:lysyl-tRNA synthetase class 2
MLSLAGVGQEALDEWKADVDIGDIVCVHGEVISSRRGELSVLGDSWQMASKALRPLPVAHKEMNEESRVRQRYVDLIVRPQARAVARQRIAVIRALRTALEQRGFLEVETPMLQTLAGGAAARPFTTHSNALDIDLYLRIAPELFLKRCVVGGFDKVFELNRVFRNEGADSTHSPEFSMLETYQAYGTYDDSAVVTRELIQQVADEAIGTRQLSLPDGSVYDIDGEWASIQMYPSLSEALGEEITPDTTVDRLLAIAEGTRCRGTRRPRVWARQAGRGTVGTYRRRRFDSTHIRQGFSGRDNAFDASAPQHRRCHREVGSVYPRIRTGHRILGIDRPGGAAGKIRRAGAGRGSRR